MKDYESALRDWFYKKAGIPSYYHPCGTPDATETNEFKLHIKRCGLIWDRDPQIGHTEVFGGTFDGNDRVSGVTATVSCKCSEYPRQELFLPADYGQEWTLGRIITEVIAEGEA